MVAGTVQVRILDPDFSAKRVLSYVSFALRLISFVGVITGRGEGSFLGARRMVVSEGHGPRCVRNLFEVPNHLLLFRFIRNKLKKPKAVSDRLLLNEGLLRGQKAR